MAINSVMKSMMSDSKFVDALVKGMEKGATILEKNENNPEKAWKMSLEKAGKPATLFLFLMVVHEYMNGSDEKTCASLLKKGIEVIGKESLDSNCAKMFKEAKQIYSFVREIDEKKLLSFVFAPKDVKDQIKQLEVLVTKTAWDKNPGQRSAITKAEKKLEKLHLSKNEKQHLAYVKTVDVAIQNFNKKSQAKEQPQVAKHSSIYTARIRDKETCKKLQAICSKWQKKAKLKAAVANAKAVHNIKKEKKVLAFDSSTMASIFATYNGAKFISKKEALYVAYDANKKLQAIATVNFSKSKEHELNMLCSNPDNIVVLGDEIGPVRGAGSSIIRHIAQDILDTSKYKKKVLTLCSLTSAEGFYKKLGFKENKHEDLVLKEAKMQAMLQKKQDTHIMQKDEPTKASLTA